MLLSAIVVGLLLAGLIVPVVVARLGRPAVAARIKRPPRPARTPNAAAKPPLRLVVRPDDMDSELKKLLEEDRRGPTGP